MSEKKKASEHRSRTVGTADDENISEQLGHRDTAHGDTSEHNEVRLDERQEEDGYGPRTHQDTRITRKDGS